MPDSNMCRTNSDSDQHLKRVRPTRLSLGSGILCISLLAGCASAPDQPQPIEPEASATTTQEASSVATPQEAETPMAEATVAEKVTEQLPASEDSSTEGLLEQTATAALTVDATATENESSTNVSSANVSSTIEPGAEAIQSPTALPVVGEADSSSVAVTSTESGDSKGVDTGNTTTETALDAVPEATSEAIAPASETEETAATNQNESLAPRSKNNLGKSYGIWTLKQSGNGYCKLSTPTLQTGNKEYSSQIWMDIEEQRVVVNAFMSLDIAHPKSGIQIDNQPLIPFSEKVYSTRAVVTGDLTTQLATGNQLHIYINGQEVGKQVLRRDVALTQMNTAIAALKSCGE